MQAQLIRLQEVIARTGLSRSAVYDLAQRGEFPPQIKLSKGGRAVAWSASEVAAWVESRIAARDSRGSAA